MRTMPQSKTKEISHRLCISKKRNQTSHLLLLQNVIRVITKIKLMMVDISREISFG